MSPSDTTSHSDAPILQSTQIKHWTFASPDQLQLVLQQTNTAAQTFIVDNVISSQASSTVATDSAGKKAKKGTLSDADLLSAEEELLVVRNNVQKMLIMCPQMHFSDAVESTAIQYFKRFFLHSSVMRYDITHIMLTSMFLATKTEEQRMSLDSFLRGIKDITGADIRSTIIRNTEQVLLEGLRFHLAVIHAYPSLTAFVHDLGASIGRGSGGSMEHMKRVYDTARDTIRQSHMTDIMFTATPGVIALSALVDACAVHQIYQEEMNRYLESKFTDSSELQRVHQAIGGICSVFSSQRLSPFDPSAASRPEKKLRKIRKTMSVYEDKVAKELQVQMERLEEEKRARKLEEIRRREKATEDFLMGRDLPPEDPNQPQGLFG